LLPPPAQRGAGAAAPAADAAAGQACSLPPRSVGRVRRRRPPMLPRAHLAPSPRAAWGGRGGDGRRWCRGPILLPPPAQRGGGPGWGAVGDTSDFAIDVPRERPVLPTPARQADSVGYTSPEEHVPTDRLARGAFHPGPGFQPSVRNPFPGAVGRGTKANGTSGPLRKMRETHQISWPGTEQVNPTHSTLIRYSTPFCPDKGRHFTILSLASRQVVREKLEKRSQW